MYSATSNIGFGAEWKAIYSLCYEYENGVKQKSFKFIGTTMKRYEVVFLALCWPEKA